MQIRGATILRAVLRAALVPKTLSTARHRQYAFGLAKYPADARRHRWEGRPRGDRDEAGHERVLDQVLPVRVAPDFSP